MQSMNNEIFSISLLSHFEGSNQHFRFLRYDLRQRIILICLEVSDLSDNQIIEVEINYIEVHV